MKGISAVIATILMLMITIAMAGVAYMYISGIFTQQTGSITDIDESATSCGTANAITVYVRNSGTIVFNKNLITVSGTNSNGAPITGVTCTAGNLNATAGSAACGNTITGTLGSNRIVVSGPSNTATGSVYCAG